MIKLTPPKRGLLLKSPIALYVVEPETPLKERESTNETLYKVAVLPATTLPPMRTKEPVGKEEDVVA